MHIQVKHLHRARSSRRMLALGMAILSTWIAVSFTVNAAEEETVTQRPFRALAMRTGHPVFGFGVRHMKGDNFVFQIFENGPASKAGLKLREALVSCDGTALSAMPLSELLEFLATRAQGTFRVRARDGALRSVVLKKAAPETFASADQVITVRAQEMATVEIGKAPPDFTAQANGKPVRLSELSGQPVVVIFWATWCLPCMAERPALKTLYAKFHPRGVEFVGVSLDDDRTKMEHDLKEHDIPWPQNFDGKGTDNAVAQEWGVTSIPVLVMIGRDGRVLEKKVPIEKLGSALEKALR